MLPAHGEYYTLLVMLSSEPSCAKEQTHCFVAWHCKEAINVVVCVLVAYYVFVHVKINIT